MKQAQAPTASTEALVAELAELRALLTAQQATITQQQAAIVALEQRTPLAQQAPTSSAAAADEAGDTPNEAPPAVAAEVTHAATPKRGTSRRGLLRGAAAGAAAAAVAAVAVGGAEQAHAAPLATGGPMLLGESNSANATTFLSNTTSGGAGLEVTATGGGVGIFALTDTGYGLSGVASGNGTGVIGVGEGSGPGVEGQGDNGVGGYFHGALAPLLLGLGGAVGAPTANAHSKGEVYLDSAATMWICTVAGTPGTWAPAGDFLLDQLNVTSATTELSNTTAGSDGFVAEATGSGRGIVGATDNGVGVQGNGNNGTGVFGLSNGNAVQGHSINATGVFGQSDNGIGGVFTGGIAPLALAWGGAPGAPTSNTHSAGEIYLDSVGTMWICKGGGVPGTWVQVVTAPSGPISGPISYLSRPIRLLDTRKNATGANQLPGTQLSGGSSFPVQVAGVIVGSESGPISVPQNAVGALGNLTVTNTTSAGFLAVVPSGAGFLNTSNVNYASGQTIPNFFTVNLAGGYLDVFVDPASQPVDVIVDLFAFVL